jgi:ABC-type Co2+ transport system permease subunit
MRRATILRVLGGRRFKVSLQLAVKRLLEYDPDIVEVVQFGSSVYAPELSARVLSALTAVLTYLPGLAFPSPTGGYTHVGDTVVYLSALLFGPWMGLTVGLIDPVVADLLVGYPRWFVTLARRTVSRG